MILDGAVNGEGFGVILQAQDGRVMNDIGVDMDVLIDVDW